MIVTVFDSGVLMDTICRPGTFFVMVFMEQEKKTQREIELERKLRETTAVINRQAVALAESQTQKESDTVAPLRKKKTASNQKKSAKNTSDDSETEIEDDGGNRTAKKKKKPLSRRVPRRRMQRRRSKKAMAKWKRVTWST